MSQSTDYVKGDQVSFVRCEICAAAVMNGDEQAHAEWHKQLQRSMAENRRSW